MQAQALNNRMGRIASGRIGRIKKIKKDKK
jgi:hypothetical protein